MKSHASAPRSARVGARKSAAAATPPACNDTQLEETARSARQAVAGPAREELIRLAAYSLYESRGGSCGNAVDDWLKAEALVDQAARADAGEAPSRTNH